MILLFIVIVTSTLFNISDDIAQKGGKFASAQTQTSNAAIDLKGMLGPPLYHSNNAKVTALRVIDVEVPKTEMSIIEKGTMLGIGNVTNIGTFVATYKTNRIILGEGKGIITVGNNGISGNNTIGWTSQDIGRINSDGSQNYHGIMFFLGSNSASSTGKLGFLSNTAALYTTSIASNGTTLRQIWQWKWNR